MLRRGSCREGTLNSQCTEESASVHKKMCISEEGDLLGGIAGGVSGDCLIIQDHSCLGTHWIKGINRTLPLGDHAVKQYMLVRALLAWNLKEVNLFYPPVRLQRYAARSLVSPSKSSS